MKAFAQYAGVQSVLRSHRVLLHAIEHAWCRHADAHAVDVQFFALDVVKKKRRTQPRQDIDPEVASRRNVLDGGIFARQLLGI